MIKVYNCFYSKNQFYCKGIIFSNFQTLSMTWFVESAKTYKLKGRSLEELCDHNASVARDLDRHQVGICWNLLEWQVHPFQSWQLSSKLKRSHLSFVWFICRILLE